MCANLSGADLSEANLRRADLYGANLYGADLYGANLCGADLDFSCWPLWCGSKNIIIDDRIASQLIYHITRCNISKCSGGVREAITHIRAMGIANLFCDYRNVEEI